MNHFCGLRSDDHAPSAAAQILPQATAVQDAPQPSKFYTPEVLSDMREMYHSTSKMKPYACDIAIHARRGDVLNPRDISGKPHWRQSERVTTDDAIRATISAMQSRFPNEKICVFTQGTPEEFEDLKERGIDFVLNGSIRYTFHSLVCAPRLVIANSSFSYTAGLLNSNDVYCLNANWWHKPLDHWTVLGL